MPRSVAALILAALLLVVLLPDLLAASEVDAERLARYEAVVARFFRETEFHAEETRLNEATSALDAWARQRAQELNAEVSSAESDYETTFAALKAEIDDYDRQIATARRDGSPTETVNELIDSRNALTREAQQLSESYRSQLKDCEARIDAFNRERKARLATRAEQENRYLALANARREFFDSHHDEAFWRELNEFYATLWASRHADGGRTEVDGAIQRLRELRREIGEWAMRTERESPNPRIVVPARLMDRETVYLVVDTGASSVSLAPETIVALDEADNLGEEVESQMADGSVLTGRRYSIPSIAVLGMKAKSVEATVHPRSTCGTDGLLGCSFLMRFRVTIDSQATPMIRLDPLAAQR